MDKPENPYRKDSILWRLFEGDWSGKTPEQIAAELFVEEHSLYSLMSTIKSKTGYRVAYIKVPRDSSARANRTSMKKPWIKLPPSYRRPRKAFRRIATPATMWTASCTRGARQWRSGTAAGGYRRRWW